MTGKCYVSCSSINYGVIHSTVCFASWAGVLRCTLMSEAYNAKQDVLLAGVSLTLLVNEDK
jgi:hypothetical protein